MTELDSLTKSFVDAAIALAGAITVDIKHSNPQAFAAVNQAVEQGELLALTITFDEGKRRIALTTASDYGVHRAIACIPLKDAPDN